MKINLENGPLFILRAIAQNVLSAGVRLSQQSAGLLISWRNNSRRPYEDPRSGRDELVIGWDCGLPPPLPPPPSCRGIIGLAENSPQNLDVKELKPQNLRNKALRARRLAVEQTASALTMMR